MHSIIGENCRKGNPGTAAHYENGRISTTGTTGAKTFCNAAPNVALARTSSSRRASSSLHRAQMLTTLPAMSPLDALPSAPELRDDIRRLGDLLGEAIIRQEGAQMFSIVESIRTLTRDDPDEAAQLIDDLTLAEATTLARAFSLYFHLANIVEQVHRAQSQAAERALTGGPLARAGAAIRQAMGAGEVTQEQVAAGFATSMPVRCSPPIPPRPPDARCWSSCAASQSCSRSRAPPDRPRHRRGHRPAVADRRAADRPAGGHRRGAQRPVLPRRPGRRCCR